MTISEYNQCVDLYSDGLYRFALSLVKLEQDAEDVVQDCFEKMWKKHDEVSFVKAKSYLFTACHHTAIDLLRRKNKLIQIEIEKESDIQENYIQIHGKKNIKEVLFSLLEKLPHAQQSVLLLRDYEGYAYDEIAQITGLSVEQVRVYIFRARMKMREMIGKMENLI
ncbi:MAG: RNA polymerase sigma factor [Bacteroidia bacterium]|nr:RNA polymerase sigma factor [Bacteroidia bacterium]